MVSRRKRLTPKQKRFVEEYLVDLNATRAAKTSGYAEKTAYRIGFENLRKPQIQAAVQRRQAELSEKTQITQERVLEEEAAIAFSNITDLFDEDGNIIETHKLPEPIRYALSSIEVKDLPDGSRKYKFRLWDKGRALERISKYLGMYERDNRQKRPTLEEVFAALKAVNLEFAEAVRQELMRLLESRE